MRLDPTDRRHSLWFFFGGLAELLLGRVDAAVALLEKSLECDPSYGTAQLFPAALCLLERPDAAARLAASFRGQYPDYPPTPSSSSGCRSPSPTYCVQVQPLVDKIRSLNITP